MTEGALDEDDALAAQARARVGDVLQGRWTLLRLLGIGGAAAVYEAEHRNGKRAAIKLLHSLYAGNEDMRTRFLREGYVANKIAHPGVVSVLDDGVDESGAAFLVMELLIGESLEGRRERVGGRLAPDEVLGALEAALDVLVVAHEVGVVHRDLKPENLFRTTAGQIKVLDFGIARLLERSTSATATSAHSYMGTPAFMPPEQASAKWKEVDARTDIWALGATAHVLATGLYVHDGETTMQMLANTIMHPPRPTRERAPYVPAALAAVIDRALAFRMGDRYQSSRSMLEAVREARGSVGQSAVPGRPDDSPVVRLTPRTADPAANTVLASGDDLRVHLGPQAPPHRTETSLSSSGPRPYDTSPSRAPSRSFPIALLVGALLATGGVALGAALYVARAHRVSSGSSASASRPVTEVTAARATTAATGDANASMASTPTVTPGTSAALSATADPPTSAAPRADASSPPSSKHSTTWPAQAPSHPPTPATLATPATAAPGPGPGPLTNKL